MDYDFIATHTPQNITASKVMQKGVHYDPRIKTKSYHSENPSTLVKTNKLKLTNQPEFKDFTGQKHGRFTIVGLTESKGNYGKWLVKCSCGIYETRTTKAIKNHANNPGKYDEDMCLQCADLRKIRLKATAKSMGYEYKEYCEKFLPRNNKSENK